MSKNPKHPVTSRGDKQCFLVGPKSGRSPEALRGLLEKCKSAPEEMELHRITGDESNPELLVVAMTPERAERLRREEAALIIEKDEPWDPNTYR